MPVLTFGEFKPDLSDINRAQTSSVLNVLPQADGYGPFRDLQSFTEALPDACRGLFFAQETDGTVAIFAGTADRLYLLNNSTLDWEDVSQSGSAYTSLDPEAHWSFAQFNSVVIATQDNDDVQSYTLGSSSEFADLGGSPPRAAYVTIINRFVVLSGLAANTNRVQWSALNAVTNWSTAEADSQDLPDGGAIMGVTGGEYGVIIQQSAIRRMVFAPNSEEVFQINRIAKGIGTDFPHSIVDLNGIVFFLSQKGFMRLEPEGGLVPIGEERIDRTFLREYDGDLTRFVIGAGDPRANMVLWTYNLASDPDDTSFHKILAFDFVQNRWAPIVFQGQYLSSIARPGVTLEGLNLIGSVAISNAVTNGGLIRLTVASTTGMATGDIKDIFDVGGVPNAIGQFTITVINGTTIDLQGSTFAGTYTSGGYVAGSVDAMTVSLDSFSVSGLVHLAGVSTSGAVGLFTGDTLEASIETAEQTGTTKRAFFEGFHPIADAPSCFVSVGKRENPRAAAVYTAEASMNDQGFAPLLLSTRYARLKLRIPADTEWTYATGIEPVYQEDGEV